MAVERDEYIFDLVVNDQQAAQKVNRLYVEFDKLTKQVAKQSITGKQATESFRKIGQEAGYTVGELKQLEQQFGQLQKSSKLAGSKGLGFFTQQLGFLATDARYGPLAVANNISILASTFQTMSANAGGAGKAMANLFQFLKGGGWFFLAIQLAISVMPELIDLFKNWGKETEKVNDATKALTANVDKLAERIKKNSGDMRGSSGLFGWLGLTKVDDMTWFEDMFDQVYKRQGGKFYKKQLDMLKDFSKKYPSLFNYEEFMAMGPTDAREYYREQLKLTDDFFKELAAKIEGWKADLEVKKILGTIDPLSAAEEELRIWVETQEALNTDPEIYMKNPEYKKLQARLQKAQQDSENFMDGFDNPMVQRAIEIEKKKQEEILKLKKAYIQWGIDEEKAGAEATARVNKKYKRIQLDEELSTAQQRIGIMANFLQQAAQLDTKNKALAKAAIVANAAVASIGIWRDYHGEKNTIPTPFNTIAAAVQQGLLIASTAQALRSLSSDSAPGSAAAPSAPPSFNIIGNTSSNQIQDTIDRSANRGTNMAVTLEVDGEQVDTAIKKVQEVQEQASI